MTLLSTTDAEIESVIGMHSGLVLIKLTADWCGPCKMYNPVLEQLNEEDSIPVYNLDIDRNPDTPRKNGVMSIPTVLVFYDGMYQRQFTGAKPLAALRKELTPYLDSAAADV